MANAAHTALVSAPRFLQSGEHRWKRACVGSVERSLSFSPRAWFVRRVLVWCLPVCALASSDLHTTCISKLMCRLSSSSSMATEGGRGEDDRKYTKQASKQAGRQAASGSGGGGSGGRCDEAEAAAKAKSAHRNGT